MKASSRLARVLAAAVLLAAAAAPARAAVRKTRYYLSYDYYLPASAADGLKDFDRGFADNLLINNFDAADYRVHRKGGNGFRVGALYPLDARSFVGGNVGYVVGPTANSSLQATSALLGTGSQSIDLDVTFVRYMAQSVLRFPLTEHLSFDAGTSAGLATGQIQVSCTSSGAVVCGTGSAKRVWTGLAWELAPDLVWHLERSDLVLGLRYAVFPKFNGSDQLPAVDWRTYGISLGGRF